MDNESNDNIPSEVTLDEFCMRRSREDRRVELLAAFHATERAAGRFKGHESEFASRLVQFANQPA